MQRLSKKRLALEKVVVEKSRELGAVHERLRETYEASVALRKQMLLRVKRKLEGDQFELDLEPESRRVGKRRGRVVAGDGEGDGVERNEDDGGEGEKGRQDETGK